MVFADLLFLYIFLPLNMALYFLSRNINYRNTVLVAFSLFFYAWGEPVWISILLLSATVNYLFGLLIGKHREKLGGKVSLILSLVFNLGLLALFKYSGLFVSTLNGLGLNLPIPQIALPIGISFYTFQIISYVVDVYRGETKEQRSFLRFLLFVSLYHQLVAGPIVRYSQIAHEIASRDTDVREISTGITRFCYGLAKKVVISNVAGTFATQYLDGDLSTISVGGAWFGIIMFTLQIYYDFSGYSDMAIGLGKVFGFHYPENFLHPYISASASEFWKRWHITLSSFFKDYLYIPLGGNRRRKYLNIFIVWFATGLWHGASWNFVLWGLFWGFFVSIEKTKLFSHFHKIPSLLRHCYLLFLVVISWVLFYFTDLSSVGHFLRILFGFAGNPLWDLGTQILIFGNVFWIFTAFFFAMPMLKGFNNVFAFVLSPKKQKILLYLQPILNAIILLVCTAMLANQSYNPFLYYRF